MALALAEVARWMRNHNHDSTATNSFQKEPRARIRQALSESATMSMNGSHTSSGSETETQAETDRWHLRLRAFVEERIVGLRREVAEARALDRHPHVQQRLLLLLAGFEEQ